MEIERFLSRMKTLLGDEYDDFYAALGEDEVKAYRINRIKYREGSIDIPGFDTTPIPYCSDGYIIEGNAHGIGNTPEHHAGIIYVQDPAAMATAEACEIEPDFAVCDMCAAPGGKTTQIAAKLGPGGFLLSNEYVPKRAKILVGNVERMGAACVAVTSMDTSEIAKLFRGFFDLVVVDAPCSGEGMLRKDAPVEEEWSEDAVIRCAKRQGEILENAHVSVKAGGHLLYSTCTYSPEENELTVAAFLSAHPEYKIVSVKAELAAASCDGIVPPGTEGLGLELTRRFYPHKCRGEGQYIALLQKTGGEDSAICYRDASQPLSREEAAAVKAFFAENFASEPSGKAVKHGNNIVFIAHGYPLMPHSVFSAGVLIGEVQKGRLIPAHQLFSAYGNLFKRKIELSYEDAVKYIAGEELKLGTDVCGWCALTYLGAVIGGGKASAGAVKNHYPKGLRKRL